MKRIVSTAVLAMFAIGGAQAADLGYKKPSPVPVMTHFSWTGFYVGVDAGYSVGRSNFNVTGAAGAVSTPEPSGFSIGGHAGYRYQLQNNVVLGAEVRAFGNIDTRDQKKLGGFANFGRTETRWGGDARLSLGYAMGRFLPYLAGGVALADIKGCTTTAGGAACGGATASFSDTRVGWTIGGGLAYAFTNNLIARVDYAYSDFGSKNFSTPGVAGGNTKVKLQTHGIRAGLSYKF
jgi:outer membrane immunogenic protein